MVDIKNIKNYLSMNKLKLNTEKTKIMLLPENKIICKINEFECVRETKYLGVIIDCNLNFKKHFEMIHKKIAKKIGFFRRIRRKLCMDMAIKVYNSIIQPHFEYCPTILLLGSEVMINKLQILQNKGMRAILYCNRYTSISYMLNTLKWLSVKQKIVMNTLIFIFKVKNNLMPNYLQRRLVTRSEIRPYSLRNNNNLHLPFFRNCRTQNMLFYKGIQIYNNLPDNVKIETNLLRYKHCIKHFVKNNY